jgi:multidrug efflux pump subunit AcrA (membrane-fusion protein)
VRHVPPRSAVLFAGCALILPLTAASCGDEPTDVALGTAIRATVAENVEAQGSVTARAAATLTAPADGTLGALRVDAGDRVRKGQVVAVIDSPTAQRRLRDAEKAVDQADRAGVRTGGSTDFAAAQRSTDAEADAAFTSARDAAGKIADPVQRKALLAQVKASEKRYDASSKSLGQALRSLQRGVAGLGRATNALASAQRLQAKQAYDLADATVDALTLKAPISGVVQLGGTAAGGSSSLSDLISAGGSGAAAGKPAGPLPGVDAAVPKGAVVTAGTAILTIVDTAQLGLTAEVDETDVLLVRPGGVATVELEAATGASYPAKVRAIDVLPTTSARGGVSYRVRLILGTGAFADGSAAPVPRPGMSAIVRLRVRQAADAVTVPAGAVFSADGRDAVWAVRDGKAERIDVTVGVQGDDTVQIVSGVGDGQQVVVGGTDQVRSGQQIR